MNRKANSSQAAWALIMEGVTGARVEAHKVKKMLNLASNLVENSSKKEHLYQVGGDLIMGLPQAVEQVIRDLDRTAYALARIGTEHLKDLLTLEDRARVENGTSNPPRVVRVSAAKVADLYLRRKR